jgi:DNA polymerase-4
MHIDLNSCFATIEAQANRLLRGRPIGVAAYDTPRGFVLAANYAAKAKGVKLGVNVQEARQMCPGIVIMTPDPAKYREAHKRFKELLLDYTDDVHPKSIDEFVLNFTGSPAIRAGKSMKEIGLEIKQRIYESLGEAVTVNIGIAPNRFLAKYAAGFNKPDGLTQIDHTNLIDRYKNMDLVDLPGINTRFRARLFAVGITNPLEFLAADVDTLQKRVFKSIVGYYWYLRLRGWEIDNYESTRKSIGHQYALPHKTSDLDELKRLLRKLCEKVGRRLRKNELYAGGIHLYLGFVNYQEFIPSSFENMHRIKSWKQGTKVDHRLYSTEDIYEAACHLLNRAILQADVKLMSITVYNLKPWDPEQLTIFSGDRYLQTGRRISDALDAANNRYGEFVLTPATMMDMKGTILDRVAFGQVRDL